MAKGVISFEFETLFDLENQLREALGMGRLVCVDPDTMESAPNMAPPNMAPRGVPGIFLGEGMSAASLVGKSPMAGKTAIMDDVRKNNAEAAKEEVKTDTAPTTTAETTPTPVPEKPVEATSTASVPGAVTETLTVEDIPKAEYKDLLAFCERNPGVGLDVSKCQHEYFRKYVEIRVKTYLETK